MEQIERKVDEAFPRRAFRNRLLHRFKAAAAIWKQHDQFTIDQPISDAESVDGLGDLRELRCPIQSVPADQSDAAV